MMAISRRGTSVPPIRKLKTSLGLGQGTVVDIRTVMYEIRNELKMNVSLKRKIHIIALPHGTFLNARWSDDQSATMPCTPPTSGTACSGFATPVATAGCVMSLVPLLRLCMQQDGEQHEPYQEQIVPVHRAKLHAQPQLGDLDSAQHFAGGPAPDPKAAQEVDAMQRGEQVEERRGGVARQEIACVAQLLTRPKLPGQKGKGEDAGDDQADSHAVRLSPAGSGARPLHR